MNRIWLLYLVLIFGLSTVPGPERVMPAPPMLDKVAHFLLYAGLAWIYTRRDGEPGAALGALARAALLAAAVGLGDELYQGLVPRRTPDPADWVADVAGGLFGACLALGYSRLRALRRENGGR